MRMSTGVENSDDKTRVILHIGGGGRRNRRTAAGQAGERAPAAQRGHPVTPPAEWGGQQGQHTMPHHCLHHNYCGNDC